MQIFSVKQRQISLKLHECAVKWYNITKKDLNHHIVDITQVSVHLHVGYLQTLETDRDLPITLAVVLSMPKL